MIPELKTKWFVRGSSFNTLAEAEAYEKETATMDELYKWMHKNAPRGMFHHGELPHLIYNTRDEIKKALKLSD